MPITLSWNEDQSIAYTMFEPRWTWDDFHHVNDEILYVMNTVTHPVHIVSNTGQAGPPPPGFITQVKRIYNNAHPNAGYTVIIGVTPFVRMLFQSATRVYSYLSTEPNLRFATDLDEAHAIISQYNQAAG